MKKGFLILSIVVLMIFSLFSGCTTEQDNDESGDDNENNLDNTGENGTSPEGEGSRPNILLWPDSAECDDIDDFKFSSSPIDLDEVTYILPMGGLTGIVGGHIIPGEHVTISYDFGPSLPPVDIHAVADGYLVMAERHVYTPYEGYPEDMRHYHLYFEHSCTMYTGFVHVTELDQSLLDADESLRALDEKDLEVNENYYCRIPITAGQVIGKARAFGFIGMLTVDTDTMITGYAIPENYDGQPWRLYSVAPFDYFEEPLRSQMYDKIPRTSEPRGGKFDFDIDGKLVGNWFQQGVERWQATETEGNCGNNVCPYWDGHLSFVYDSVEPEKIRVNVGYDLNRGVWQKIDGPYGVLGNSPDPSDIGIEDGVVKFELVALTDVTLEQPGIDPSYKGGPIFTENDESEVLATLLAQVIDNQSIKVEIFTGLTAEEVTGFTDDAMIYER